MMRFAEQQQAREDEIKAKKAELEAQKESIFQRLKEEEELRRAEKDYIENLRNELQIQEFEELARKKEQEELEKRERIKQELLAA